MASNSPSISTPEYVTFRKCYPDSISYMSKQPGDVCDRLFSEGYISPEVRDQARNVSKTEKERAQKLADTLIDKIKQNPSVFHGFIKIIEKDGPWASDFFEAIKERYEAEIKLQQRPLKKEKSKELPQTEHTGSTATNDDEHFSSDDSFHSTTEPDQVSLQREFPYLKVSSLSEDEKVDLVVQLRSETRSIKERFSDFRAAIRNSLDSRIPLDKIKDTILSLDAFTDGIGLKVLDPEDEKKIEIAESVSKIFMALRSYTSFFNYQIIERLISQYGTSDDKKLLQDYCQALADFCQRNVYEIPPKTYSSPRAEAKELVFKCTQDTLTLHDVQVIREKAARILGLNYSVLQLSTIEEGCVELHFLISAAVADHIFPLSSFQYSSLNEIGVRILAR